MTILGWFSVVAQLYLMVDNSVIALDETIIRFFTFFTILTNILVALYFTSLWIGIKQGGSKRFNSPGTFTAITTYITVVGITYQILLRHTWQPTGLQMIVDELLHTIIPLLVIIYWLMFPNKSQLKYKQIINWLIYPLVYLMVVLIRGEASGYYPYPFVDVAKLGFQKVISNSVLLVMFFHFISAFFVWMGNRLQKKG